jgi:hypothetical protein
VTLPDGTPVSSGESGGVKVGGGGAYQGQFTKHMFLPMPADQPVAPDDGPPAPIVLMAEQADPLAPPPDPLAPPPPADPFAPPPPSPDAPPPADPFAPPPPAPDAPPPAPDVAPV